MRRFLSLLGALLFASAPLAAQAGPKVPACDTAAVLAKATPTFGVGAATIRNTCGTYASWLDAWAASQDSTTQRVVRLIAHGIAASPVVVAPVDTPSTPVVVAPAPTKGCVNEPRGATLIEDQPWNSVLPKGWIDDDRTNFARGKIVADATAPLSPPSVVAGLFPAGMTGGGAPFYVYRPFSAGEQYRTLYVCVVMKHSADFDNTNGNAGTKLFWPAGDQVQGAQTYVTLDGPNMNVGVNLQGGAERELYANVGDGHVGAKRGQWVIYEFAFGASSSNGAADGTLSIWIDGVQTHRYTDVRWQMGSARKWLSFAWNPTYGGGTHPVPHDQTETIDHLRLSGVR